MGNRKALPILLCLLLAALVLTQGCAHTVHKAGAGDASPYANRISQRTAQQIASSAAELDAALDGALAELRQEAPYYQMMFCPSRVKQALQQAAADEQPRFAWPIASNDIEFLSPYGMRTWRGRTRLHKGLDIRAPRGTDILSVMEGRVQFSGWRRGYGHLVLVDHPDGMTTAYAHLSKRYVSTGDRVDRAEPLGLVGTTGRSTCVHLHFEVRVADGYADPVPYLEPVVPPAYARQAAAMRSDYGKDKDSAG
jgi:murein DD-endopeptidase MepM/ murein hydrolase activator NlpD